MTLALSPALALGWLAVALLGAVGARSLVLGAWEALDRRRGYQGLLAAAVAFEEVREENMIKIIPRPYDWNRDE